MVVSSKLKKAKGTSPHITPVTEPKPRSQHKEYKGTPYINKNSSARPPSLIIAAFDCSGPLSSYVTESTQSGANIINKY
ncbi:unnamed protein product, partial [Nesidiocoris tenuis]